jgi:hypothetical protein
MIDVPVVAHVSKLVADLTSRSVARHDVDEDENKVSRDETEKRVT